MSNLTDFYRARFLYRLSQGGEAVESALVLFVQTLQRRAELQTVALEDIAGRLQTLRSLASDPEPDVAKIHETLRDLVRVFESLAENAQAFMAGVARSIELQQAEAGAVASYKRRLIDYLERFMGDLVRRSDTIAGLLLDLEPQIDTLLEQIAVREAHGHRGIHQAPGCGLAAGAPTETALGKSRPLAGDCPCLRYGRRMEQADDGRPVAGRWRCALHGGTGRHTRHGADRGHCRLRQRHSRI